MKKNKKKSQVWVETVIYTMIALVIIGLVLSYAKPKIEESQDKIIIEQSANILTEINNVVLKIFQMGPGNKRKIDISVKKGEFIIDAEKEIILFEIYGNHEYTEIGKNVSVADTITAITEIEGRYKKVTLTLNLTDFNLTYDIEKKIKSIGRSTVPYEIFITNYGGAETGETNIDIVVK